MAFKYKRLYSQYKTTYTYKKINHKKDVERQVHLLGGVIVPLLTLFNAVTAFCEHCTLHIRYRI